MSNNDVPTMVGSQKVNSTVKHTKGGSRVPSKPVALVHTETITHGVEGDGLMVFDYKYWMKFDFLTVDLAGFDFHLEDANGTTVPFPIQELYCQVCASGDTNEYTIYAGLSHGFRSTAYWRGFVHVRFSGWKYLD